LYGDNDDQLTLVHGEALYSVDDYSWHCIRYDVDIPVWWR